MHTQINILHDQLKPRKPEKLQLPRNVFGAFKIVSSIV